MIPTDSNGQIGRQSTIPWCVVLMFSMWSCLLTHIPKCFKGEWCLPHSWNSWSMTPKPFSSLRPNIRGVYRICPNPFPRRPCRESYNISNILPFELFSLTGRYAVSNVPIRCQKKTSLTRSCSSDYKPAARVESSSTRLSSVQKNLKHYWNATLNVRSVMARSSLITFSWIAFMVSKRLPLKRYYVWETETKVCWVELFSRHLSTLIQFHDRQRLCNKWKHSQHHPHLRKAYTPLAHWKKLSLVSTPQPWTHMSSPVAMFLRRCSKLLHWFLLFLSNLNMVPFSSPLNKGGKEVSTWGSHLRFSAKLLRQGPIGSRPVRQEFQAQAGKYFDD